MRKRLEGLGCEIREQGDNTFIKCPTSAFDEVLEEMGKPNKFTIKFEGD